MNVVTLHETGASLMSAKAKGSKPVAMDIVKKAIERDPEGTREEQFEVFRSLLKKDTEREALFYFFVNMRSYFVTNRSIRDPMQRAQAKQQQEDMVESIKAQIMLLDLTMPNGKPMKDCTGAEMSKFGNRYQRIAEKVGKAKLVGAVLNEEQVRGILK